jgi:hypothetical protein
MGHDVVCTLWVLTVAMATVRGNRLKHLRRSLRGRVCGMRRIRTTKALKRGDDHEDTTPFSVRVDNRPQINPDPFAELHGLKHYYTKWIAVSSGNMA